MVNTGKDAEEPVAQQHVAHFRIDGGDLTRIARERLLEDAPGHAWRIASCLGNQDGDDRDKGVADAALKILQGKAKLVGDERCMELVDEPVDEHGKPTDPDTIEFLERLKYTYAGRLRVNDKWYRPVAYVSDVGPNDMKNSHGKSVYRPWAGRGYINRAWHYCGTDEIVIDSAYFVDNSKQQREVIFRTCGERPHWEQGPLHAQAAVEEFLAAGHGLEERSHSRWYGDGRAFDPMPLTGDDEDDDEDDAVEQRVRATNNRVLDELELDEERAREDEAEEAMRKHAAEVLRKQREEDEDRDERATEAARQVRLKELRVQILAQAGNDLINLSWPDKLYSETDEARGKGKAGTVQFAAGNVKIPRAPFMHWAFARMKKYADQLPPWKTISRSGMKMANDDPHHTDWVIGAGFDPQKDFDNIYHSGPIGDAALTLASELQDTFDRPAVHVLVDGPYAHGPIVHGRPNKPVTPGAIVVLPNLRPHYLETIQDAAAVITEQGGELAHLAQIGRERSLPMVRIPDARKKFPEGTDVVVDTAGRNVEGM